MPQYSENATPTHSAQRTISICVRGTTTLSLCIYMAFVSIEIWQGKTVHVLTNEKLKYILLFCLRYWLHEKNKHKFQNGILFNDLFYAFWPAHSMPTDNINAKPLPYTYIRIYYIFPYWNYFSFFLFSSIDIELFFMLSLSRTMKRKTSK